MASHDCHVISQELSKQEYEEWLIGHHEAEVSLTNRDELLFQSYLAIEKKLELLGECSLSSTSLHDQYHDQYHDHRCHDQQYHYDQYCLALNIYSNNYMMCSDFLSVWNRP